MSDLKEIKSILRKGLSISSYYSGFCLVSRLLGFQKGARIFCYHGVNETPNSHYAVYAEDFRKQMQFLAENHKIITVDQLVAAAEAKQPVPSEAVAITFDDGYLDFYTHAYPILQKLHIPATVFLPTEFIDGNLTIAEKKRLPQKDFLSWDQIREMIQNGIDFGSHSISHYSLPSLSQQEIIHQLVYSKERIETELGRKINGFAYPYGTFRDTEPKISELIRDTGYSWAVTSISGKNHEGLDPYALRRTMVEREDTLEGLKRSLNGALDGWIFIQKCGYWLSKIKKW